MKNINRKRSKLIGRIKQYRDRIQCEYYIPCFERMITDYTFHHLNHQTKKLARNKNAKCIVNDYYVERCYLDDVTPIRSEDIIHVIHFEKPKKQ